MILVGFILMQVFYHIAAIIGFRLLAKGFLEPLSMAALLLFGVMYLIRYVEDKKTTKATAAGGTQDMINIFENNNTGNSTSYFLHSMSDITFILSLIPLVIFVWLAVRSKSIKAFQFQISIFIAVYILGEIIENNRIAIFSTLPPDIGSQIHVGSAIFFTIMIWFRFYYAEKRGKKMIESSSIDDDNSNDGSGQ